MRVEDDSRVFCRAARRMALPLCKMEKAPEGQVWRESLPRCVGVLLGVCWT